MTRIAVLSVLAVLELAAILAGRPPAPLPARATGTATTVATRYYAATLSNPAPGAWQSVPVDAGVASLPWQGNQLIGFQWSVESDIGQGTASDVQLHVGLGPQGHPGGPPVMILGSELAQVAGQAPQLRDGVEVFPTPLDLNAFFTGGKFAGQPLEAQVEVDPENAGSVGAVRVVVNVLTTS